ncbi:hypothetical protein B0O99DRAFT_73802 [Bisporella sp. PMI_857]|nr:hypothetical protein B0O99DRAFT_73802 [Bisporella sp. PMI_857]
MPATPGEWVWVHEASCAGLGDAPNTTTRLLHLRPLKFLVYTTPRNEQVRRNCWKALLSAS